MTKTIIRTAYDAFWFLMEHPKLKCRAAVLVAETEKKSIVLSKGERLRKVKDEMPWCKETYWLLELDMSRSALSTNLDIYYTKVNTHGVVDDIAANNVNVECWLEFGTLKQTVSDGHLHVTHYHDVDLDCGAPTFDKALIKLARLVRRHYGDYKKPKWMTQ